MSLPPIGDQQGAQQGAAFVQYNSTPNYTGYVQVMNPHPRCECHECTQARWKMAQGSLGVTNT